MPRPSKNYGPVFDSLSRSREHNWMESDDVDRNLLKFYFCGELLTTEHGNFSIPELDFVLRQNGCHMETEELVTEAEDFVGRGLFSRTDDGRYKTNPEYGESEQIKFLSREVAESVEREMKLDMLYPLVLYATSLAISGSEVFATYSWKYSQALKAGEKEKNPEKRLENLMDELNISPPIREYTREVIGLLKKSEVKLPFVGPFGGDLAHQVTKLLHEAGIRLEHGCFDCGHHPEKCLSREDWEICSDYHFSENLEQSIKITIDGKTVIESVRDAKFGAAVEEAFDRQLDREGIIRRTETPVEVMVERVGKPVERLVEEKPAMEPIERLETEKVEWLEGSLERIKDSNGIPDEIYGLAKQIAVHLVKKIPSVVKDTVELPELVMYVSSIDVDCKGIKELLPKEGHRKESFSKALRGLTRILHETDFYLHHGCFDCNVYNKRECPEDLGERKREPWNACIGYKREGIGISRSKVEIKTGQIVQEQAASSKDEDNALKFINRYRSPIYHRPGMPSVEAFKELERQGFATSQEILGKTTFQITGKGIEEYNRRFRKPSPS